MAVKASGYCRHTYRLRDINHAYVSVKAKGSAALEGALSIIKEIAAHHLDTPNILDQDKAKRMARRHRWQLRKLARYADASLAAQHDNTGGAHNKGETE